MERKFNMNNIQGTDIDIDCSLIDYGFAWIESDCKEEYKFYYGISGNDKGEYTRFDWSWLKADIDIYNEYNWIDAEDWNSIYNYVGMDKDSFDEMPLPHKINDLLSYYGFMNIFGESYSEGKLWNANIKRFQVCKK
jgi:hypothetical protein